MLHIAILLVIIISSTAISSLESSIFAYCGRPSLAEYAKQKKKVIRILMYYHVVVSSMSLMSLAADYCGLPSGSGYLGFH